MKSKYFTLANGVKIPAVGFGTWQVKDGQEAYDSVRWALEAGYRHIDTAYVYGNETSVAKAIKDSKIDRKDIFITTKCPASIKTYNEALEHFALSLKNLNTDYIDLYLIHAPWPWNDVGGDYTKGNIEVWKAIISLYQQKKIRSIGVSNFQIKDIEALIEATNVKPMVNQIRYFIGNTQESVTSYCQENQILIEAYSPFATGEILNNEKLNMLAKKYHTTIAKICLRYCYQKNTLPLPKSVHKERIYENLDFNFEIEKEDMDYLDSLKEIGSVRPLRS
ncbi:MAG: aldo/keto reductase [Roseburia sp.]|nr:aldo/keto reductase [Anaeroplasma bactoclasticum]MCM1195744.1 aldo/keto reductase [Roseburia sp.]MCM1557665.1 aldo/keto reductase [Anaeroplasma bactoclasticum]